MIASVRGEVLRAGLDHVVVEVGGIGLLVKTTPGTATSLRRGQSAQLATSLVVREDSLTLYGFADTGEREVFRTVQTVSGIGPRLALTMLSTLSAGQIREAIATEDVALLMTVSGLGRKSAQRLIVDGRSRGESPATIQIPTWAPSHEPHP